MQQDPCIEYIEPNYILKLENTSITRSSRDLKKQPNDPELAKLWGLKKIQAEKAWDIHTGNTDVIIAVIDTGVDYNHPDLKDNMWKNPGEIAGNGIDDDNNGYIDDIYGYDFANKTSEPMDDNNHGTHIAGIIAASGDNEKGITGVSWSAKIMALKVTQHISINIYDTISAIEYAKLMGAKIINASWHIDADDHPKALYDAIQMAKDAGILFVTAAGNKSVNIDANNSLTCLQCPASYDLDNIISVASTNENDGLSPRSNFGPISVDIAAPGTNIYSTKPQEKYVENSGTSMAAPYVSGVASLLWSLNPNFTYREVKDIILSNVDPIDALKEKTVTGGRFNAYKALKNINSTVSKTKVPVAICKTSVNNFDVQFDASNSFGNIKSYKWILDRDKITESHNILNK
ncbi:S8 family peptidase [Candidatus Marithrix sp. Canyon 246]|uniref:S8 family peptidase n=1 Tax=Candidatus Marithrix sp. Canyon 246 TaxID=1827136 RepID=UPI00084A0B21|nr:S8 family peptidase [Candidatus Marithrix sp. Canyon 246]